MSSGELDPLVVRTQDLSYWLTRWVDVFNADHPYGKTPHEKNATIGFGGLRFLAQEMGADTQRRYSTTAEYRLLTKVKNTKTEYTTYASADAILTAMGEIYRLGVDIEVLPNPRTISRRGRKVSGIDPVLT